jgi:2-octaprenyl-6-methoxyphenol hydroxylase
MGKKKTQQDHRRADVLIAGGGLTGLSLAIALRRALGSSFKVALADPGLERAAENARASAIAAAARRLFETIGVWQKVADQAQPILDMVVTDSKLDDAMRPTFLTFEGELAAGEPFAHMIENAPLLAALLAEARAAGVDLRASAVSGFETSRDRVDVTLAGGEEISTRLLAAADGARSAIRERAGIASFGWNYGQSGIVTTVAHERPHRGRAEEHFLPAGPFAILPLTGNRSSIVWTEENGEAARIVALPDNEFHAELEKRFGLHLGDIAVAGPRRAYPLGLSVARAFIAERIALVGDAAHVIHPIAGQGLNMGLRDVAALAEAVVDAVRLGLDPGGGPVLERYQRWRRFDTMAMGMATDGLNRLFSNRSDALRLVRDVGLGLVERLPLLKGFFIREAAGLTGEVPKLLKGEAL